MTRLRMVVFGALSLAYPLLVYLAMGRFDPRWLALLLFALALLRALAARGVNEILLEAGAGLVGAFASQGLIDEYQLFVAGTFLGSQARPLLNWPLDRMSQAPRLKITEMRAVGDDWRVTAIPLPAPGV